MLLLWCFTGTALIRQCRCTQSVVLLCNRTLLVPVQHQRSTSSASSQHQCSCQQRASAVVSLVASAVAGVVASVTSVQHPCSTSLALAKPGGSCLAPWQCPCSTSCACAVPVQYQFSTSAGPGAMPGSVQLRSRAPISERYSGRPQHSGLHAAPKRHPRRPPGAQQR